MNNYVSVIKKHLKFTGLKKANEKGYGQRFTRKKK